MAKRFVPVRDVDRRAIQLHLMLEAIKERLPLVGVKLRDDKRAPIILFDKTDPDRWDYFSIDGVLSFNVDQALANGGTFTAFVDSKRSPARPRLPQAEIDRAVEQFIQGRDDE